MYQTLKLVNFEVFLSMMPIFPFCLTWRILSSMIKNLGKSLTSYILSHFEALALAWEMLQFYNHTLKLEFLSVIWNKNLHSSLNLTNLSLASQILVTDCGCNLEICILWAFSIVETLFVNNVGIFNFILIFGGGEMKGK